MKTIKRKSYRVYILNLFALLMLITVSSVVVNFYVRFSESTLELSDKIMDEVSKKIIDSTVGFLTPATKNIEMVARFMENHGDKGIIKQQERALKYMWDHINVSPQLLSVYLADTKGNFVQAKKEKTRVINRLHSNPTETWVERDANYNSTKKTENIATYDPRVRPWYINTQNEPKAYWSNVYVFTSTKLPGITASFPIIDPRTNKIRTVVGCDISLESMSDFLSKQKISENSIVFIVNEKDEIVAHPQASKTYVIDKISGKAHSAKVNQLGTSWISDAYTHHKKTGQYKFVTTTNNITYQSVFTDFPSSFEKKWKIVTILPEKDLIGSVNETLVQTLILSGVILAISIGIVAFISIRFSKPIILLSKETELIRDFNLDKVVGVKSHFHEINLLNESILGMKTGLQAFKKFVPSDLVRLLIQTGKEAKPGGEKKELSIMFSDIEGFTSISEKLPPEQLMIFLSDYMDELTKIIKTYSGTIDKFIGDAIMTFWGAPVELPNSPYLACQAAYDCQKKLVELNEKWKAEGKPVMNTRFGIHSGEMIVGNLGSEERLNYTVIGDSVNLGARLESVNKLYGTNIIISESTYKQVSDKFYCRFLDMVAVKGKSKGVKIYELIGDNVDSISEEKKKFCEQYEKAFNLYLTQNWDSALQEFEALQKEFPNDKSVALLIERTTYFKQATQESDALPENWDGTFVLTEK